jgi:hypothetical protein
MKNNIRLSIGLVGLGFLALSPLAQSASDLTAPVSVASSSVGHYLWHTDYHDN